jgi:NADH dehydrogenase
MSCQATGPLAVQAANTVLSRIAGTEPAVINQAFIGSCVSLGRRAATMQLSRKDDTAVKVYIGGRMGAAIKEAACKASVWGIRLEARKPGSIVWLKGGPRPEQPASAAQAVTSP